MKVRVEKQTISVREAAQILGIGKVKAYELAREGGLPGVIRLGARRFVVSLPALEQALGLPPGGLARREAPRAGPREGASV